VSPHAIVIITTPLERILDGAKTAGETVAATVAEEANLGGEGDSRLI